MKTRTHTHVPMSTNGGVVCLITYQQQPHSIKIEDRAGLLQSRDSRRTHAHTPRNCHDMHPASGGTGSHLVVRQPPLSHRVHSFVPMIEEDGLDAAAASDGGAAEEGAEGATWAVLVH